MDVCFLLRIIIRRVAENRIFFELLGHAQD